MIVEPDLPYGPRLIARVNRGGQKRLEVVEPVTKLPSMVRVNTGCAPNLRPELENPAKPIALFGTCGVEDAECASQTGRLGTVDDGVEVVHEGIIGKVAVGVVQRP